MILCWAIAGFTMLGSIIAPFLAPEAAVAAADKPMIVGSPTIVLEPQGTAGSVAVDLRNDQAEAMTLHLSVSVSQDAGQGAVVAIEGQLSTAPIHMVTIKPRTQHRIRVVLSNAGADDFDIDLLNGAERIGKVPVRHTPFGVRLTDAKAILKLYDGEPTDIRVTNGDRAAHGFVWRLRFEGQDVCQGSATLAPKSPGVLTCVPRFGWSYLIRAGALFQPLSADATLIMERADGKTRRTEGQASQPPLSLTLLPVSAQYFGAAMQQGASYVVLVLVLVLGGVVSLLLSQIIPNRISRVSLKERLDELDRMISGLGAVTSSSLRVLLRVERRRIGDVLRSRATYSPEFAAVATQSSQAVERLRRRVVLVQHLEGILRQLTDAEAAIALSFSQSARARTSARIAQTTLRNPTPSEAEFVAIEKAIADAAHQLEPSVVDEPAFQTDLTTRVGQRQQQLKELKDSNNDKEREAFQSLDGSVPAPAEMVLRGGSELAKASGAALDRAVAKVGLMLDFVRHALGVTDAAAKTRMEAPAKTFLTLLQKSNVTSITEATRVLQQIRDDVYPETLAERLGKRQARIEVDPSVVYEHVPLQFSIRFFEAAVDRAAAARGDFQCEWDFGDGLQERGWEVTHYYMNRTGKDDTYEATAMFTDTRGVPVTVGGGTAPVTLATKVTVRRSHDLGRFGERSTVELVKLAAALLIAVFGLVAGAREQIAKLDLFPGLIAVFLVGFGADTIKSLLSSKT